MCFPSNTYHPFAHKATRHWEIKQVCCVLQCKGLDCKCQIDLFLLLSPRKNGFSNMDGNFVHQKDAEIQCWIRQPRTGVAGCCSTDVSVLAQPMSAQCGPCGAIYSVAHFWIQARMLHGAKRCSELPLALRW